MSLARPSVSEERWLALAARTPQTRDAVKSLQAAGNWQCATLLTRCLLFALGLFSAGFAYSIFNLLKVPTPGLFAGLALLGTAEWLIVRRRLHASGIEEALWAAGAVMTLFEITEQIGGVEDSWVLALCAAALVVAAWRTLNPLFTTLAALLASIAVTTVTGIFGFADRTGFSSNLCFAIAFFALAAGALTFQRPAFDRMLDWLVVALPAIGYFWTLWDGDSAQNVTVTLLVAFGLAALVTGIRRRTHAPLVAALVCTVLLAVELRRASGLPLEWWLICCGSLGLLMAITLELWLRTPRNGMTSRDLSENAGTLELLQSVGAVIAMPAAQQGGTTSAPATGPTGGGGEFGGGGASGRF